MTTPLLASLGNEGPTPIINWRDKAIKTRLIDQIMKAQVEEEIYSRALKPILDAASRVPALVTQSLLKDHAEEYKQGKYSMLSEAGQRYLTTADGGFFLMRLVFGLDDVDLAALMAEKPTEVSVVMKKVIALSFGENAVADPQ